MIESYEVRMNLLELEMFNHPKFECITRYIVRCLFAFAYCRPIRSYCMEANTWSEQPSFCTIHVHRSHYSVDRKRAKTNLLFFRCHLADTLNNDVKIDEDSQIVYIHIQNTQQRNDVFFS